MVPGEVRITILGERCTVVQGVAGYTFESTPEAVGLALLSAYQNDEPSTAARDFKWVDLLATHGVAVCHRRTQRTILATVAPQTRSITVETNPDGEIISTERTFPRMLAGMTHQNGLFRSGGLWIINPATESRHISVTSDMKLLVSFPFGNVHPPGGICWGTVPTRDVQTIHEMLELFMRSHFNKDLLNPATLGIAFLPSVRGPTILNIPAPAGVLPLPSRWLLSISDAVSAISRED